MPAAYGDRLTKHPDHGYRGRQTHGPPIVTVQADSRSPRAERAASGCVEKVLDSAAGDLEV
jgi:hypothetical protein